MVDTTVKYFTSAMAGAPTLNNAAGSLIAVLDACLVNGFGVQTCSSVVIAGGVGTATFAAGHSAIEQSVVLFAGATTPAALNGERKVISITMNTIVFDASDLADGTAAGTITVKMAPAGWVKAFSGTNKAAYKSANPAASGGIARVDDTTTTYGSLRAYETMTDIDTGSGICPSVAQQAHSSWPKSSNATARPWFVIANDRCVYFGVTTNPSPAPYIYFFGDGASRKSGDAWRFMMMTNISDASPQNSSNFNPVPNASANSSGKFIARSWSGLGSSVVVSTASLFASAFSGFSGPITFPNPADNSVLLVPVFVMEGSSVVRGELPGILFTPQSTSVAFADGSLISEVPGFNRTVVYRQAGNGSGSGGGVFFDLTGPWAA